ncbi:peptide synthetase [Sesbania bispinosa]|nr:peptide synthetase [Sesbania bispinosa]
MNGAPNIFAVLVRDKHSKLSPEKNSSNHGQDPVRAVVAGASNFKDEEFSAQANERTLHNQIVDANRLRM